jgi:hypothetical protein
LRNYIIDTVFSRITGNRLTTKKENLGYDKQTNASSFTKSNYIILEAGNTPSTRHNVDTILNVSTGIYINLDIAPKNLCYVSINGVNQTVTKTNESTYKFAI